MRTTRLLGAALTAVFLAAGAIYAASDLVIPMKFVPTTKPGDVAAALRDGLSSRAVALSIVDERSVKTRDLVGEGTSDSDELFKIRTAGHFPSFMKASLEGRMNAWGVLFRADSNLILEIHVARYFVREKNEVVGSTFNAEVQLPFTLRDRAGTVFSEGTAMGTAKRYGRKRSGENCNEVLSDALEQAAANVVNTASLQDAWLAASPQPGPHDVASLVTPMPENPKRVVMATPGGKPVAPRPAALAKTPSQLLTEVTKLRRQQMSTNVVVDYVSKQTLATAFSADDLVAWKRAGVPEPVMRAALQRAP